MAHIQATGFYMVPVRDLIFCVKYGLLYNWYAATDVREIANTGWHVPTKAEFNILANYFGIDTSDGYIWPPNTLAGKLKEIGLTYWKTPNTGATNEVSFNARGSGIRSNIFQNITELLILSTSSVYNATQIHGFHIAFDSASAFYEQPYKYYGLSLRPVKDSTTLTHGQTGTYTGNDGKVYRTICIGTQEWLADNLCETKYRNGDDIPEVTDNDEWVALATGALCAYDNDWSNAYCNDYVPSIPEPVSEFAVETLSDVSQYLSWVNAEVYASIKIERSTNGVDFTVFDTIDGSFEEYTAVGLDSNTRYWWRIRAYHYGWYSNYSDVADDWTAMKFVLTSQGTGLGASTLRFDSDGTQITVTIDGTGYFAGPVQSFNFSGASGLKSVYVPSGTANVLVFSKNNLIEWGVPSSASSGSPGFIQSTTNSPSITIDVSAIPDCLQSFMVHATYHGAITGTTSNCPVSLTKLYSESRCQISGDIGDLPDAITILRLGGSTTVSGNISGFPSGLVDVIIIGSNTLSGNVSGIPNTITRINITGSNTITGDVSGIPQNSILTDFQFAGNNTISGDIAGLDYSGCVLDRASITGNNTVSGNVSGIPDSLTYLYLIGYNTVTGDIAGMPNISASINITGANTISGDIGDVPSLITYLYITGSNTISGDIGGLPVGSITYLRIDGDNTISGDIAGLDASGCILAELRIQGDNTISGDIGDIPTTLTNITISGLHTLTGALSGLHEGLRYFNFSGIGASTITGDIATIPTTVYSANVTCANTISGDITDVPAALTTLIVYGSNTISGDITDWSDTLTNVYIIGLNTITGPLSGLTSCTALNRFQIYGLNTISGDLNDLPGNIRYLVIEGDNTISDYSPPSGGKSWFYDPVFFSILPASGGGLSSTEIDDLIIDLADSITATRLMNIDLRGNNDARTAASDAAVATLSAKGRTVTTNP